MDIISLSTNEPEELRECLESGHGREGDAGGGRREKEHIRQHADGHMVLHDDVTRISLLLSPLPLLSSHSSLLPRGTFERRFDV